MSLNAKTIFQLCWGIQHWRKAEYITLKYSVLSERIKTISIGYSAAAVWSLGHVQLCDPMAVACQPHLYTGFPKQEYWRGCHVLPQGNLPNPGIEPSFPAWQVDVLPLSHLGSPPLIIRELQIKTTVSLHICQKGYFQKNKK